MYGFFVLHYVLLNILLGADDLIFFFGGGGGGGGGLGVMIWVKIFPQTSGDRIFSLTYKAIVWQVFPCKIVFFFRSKLVLFV